MKIKTSELTGAALDWAVAKAEGRTVYYVVERDHGQAAHRHLTRWAAINVSPAGHDVYAPSTDWSQGGPIKEREGINDFRHNRLRDSDPFVWCAHKVVPRPNMEGSTNMVAIAIDGPTPLVAAMRCYVASKLGDEVDVPEELV